MEEAMNRTIGVVPVEPSEDAKRVNTPETPEPAPVGEHTPPQGYKRCIATTRKGTQCANEAKNGDFCKKHGGK